MRAIELSRYGGPEDLRCIELPRPEPGPGEVRVEVAGASINDWDWGLVRGRPLYIRALCGWRAPRVRVPGVDASGRVAAVGEGVTDWVPGDAVMGDLSDPMRFGAFAEHVVAPAGVWVRAPRSVPLRDAAGLPHAAALAYQSLVEVAGLRAGQRVLVNGAGGGVGTIAVGLARHLGAREVVAVDAAEKLPRLLELGYDAALDYRSTDFTREAGLFDVVLDVKTTRPPGHYARALAPGGTYVTVGGDTGRLLQLATLGRLRSGGGRRLRVLALKPGRGVAEVAELLDTGEVQLEIDGVHPLEEASAALRRFGEARHTGKVLLDVAGASGA